MDHPMFSQIIDKIENTPKIGILLPTYCEAKNIEKLIFEIKKIPLSLSILVIDDSSPDGTADKVLKLQEIYPNLLLHIRPEKKGLGSAITDGFKIFLSSPNSPKYVVTMDADYSHDPKILPHLISSMNNQYDLVIGSRYCQGGKTKEWPLTRKIISKSANYLAKSLLGLNLYDCTSGYRCYSTKFLRRILPFLHSQTYDIQIETVKQANQQGFKVLEIPIEFVNRKKGKSKLSIFEIENFCFYLFKNLFIT